LRSKGFKDPDAPDRSYRQAEKAIRESGKVKMPGAEREAGGDRRVPRGDRRAEGSRRLRSRMPEGAENTSSTPRASIR
jgi:hypothetical protein